MNFNFNDPPPSSIYNVTPKGREYRQRVNKEEMERSIVKHRRAGFSDYAEAGDNPLIIGKNSIQYISEEERFGGLDASIQAKIERDTKFKRKEEFLAKKREMNIKLEEERKKRDELISMNEDSKWNFKRQQRENNTILAAHQSIPYDPITLQYHETSDGRKLQEHDEQVKVNAAIRTQALYEKQNSAFNPITGEPVKTFDYQYIHKFF